MKIQWHLWRPALLAGASLLWTVGASNAVAAISQSPLLLGGGNVPGNLALVPSVEYPTVISVANLGNYDHSSNYAGYFDYRKCYSYIEEGLSHPFFGAISGADGGGYFTPTRFARDCTENGEWSGNYLNWATTQTIDPFRKALTGGYRVVDTTTQTILEKATRAGRSEYFPNRSVSGSALVAKVSPFSSNSLASSVTSPENGGDATDIYRKNKTVKITSENNSKYYSVRIEVCKANLLEDNCVEYEDSWKPEGLIQKYAREIRYSVFGYLNINGNDQNGGVLRQNQKYVGHIMRSPGQAEELSNAYAEWNQTTGIIHTNPHNDPTGNSGVINYINKFGELTNQHKSNDPVSELYYTALRYFQNKGNLSSYSSGADTDTKKDKFPVITDWEDPIQYSCQRNVILGIGDVYTHEDRNLPPSDDAALDVNRYTQKVFELEGINKTASNEFTGRGNSAYIAGLAYYANTTDIRPAGDNAVPGKQTIATHWVDVRENQNLEPKNANQYWLAAKYGGFKAPSTYTFGGTLQDSWWWTSGDYLNAPTNDYKRPQNFYVASDANRMIESLEEAFAKIALEVRSTTTSLSLNSTKLETGTAVFQSLLDSSKWSGDLQAKAVSNDAVISDSVTWSAAAKLDALSNTGIDSRKIFTTTAPSADTASGALRSTSTSAVEFKWASLNDTQKTLLQAGSPAVDATTGEKRVEYLRGKRTDERSSTTPSALFRERGSRLGDIVNSDPQFVHKPDLGYARLPETMGGATAYTTFRNGLSRDPVVVVGANDGMLHVFDASLDSDGGQELFAYIPNSVMANLYELTLPAYAHRYYVDGTPRIGDAYIDGNWKTLVIGSTGAGGKSIFALDITNPSSMNSSSVLWEFTHPEMGYTLGRPSLVALHNGKFGVVVTSGYERFNNDGTRKTTAYVWVLDADDGSVIKRFDLPTSGDLGSPLVLDLDNDRLADRIYAADTTGKVWRLDIASSSTSAWGAPDSLGSTPLFVATDDDNAPQSITAPLNATYTADGKLILVFGTGSYYRTTDNEVTEDPQIQSFYGIFDEGTPISGRSALQEQEILVELTGDTFSGRGVSDETLSDSDKGWFYDLMVKDGTAKGERVVAQAQLGGNRVTFTTLVPSDDPCAAGGSSWIMTVDLASGGRLLYSYFDYNGDGEINDEDYIEIDGQKVPVSGISDPDTGVIKTPSMLSGNNNGKRYLCYASSNTTTSCIEVLGTDASSNRLSWREIREN